MSFYYPPWNNSLEPNQGNVLSLFSFSTVSGAVKRVRHCSHESLIAFNACFFGLLSRVFNGIRGIFSSKLITTRITAKFCSVEKCPKFISAIQTRPFYGLSFFPRFNSVFFLAFPSNTCFQPLSCYCQLSPSLFKVKTALFPMSFKMFRPVEHFQVFNFVISLITIFMVNVHSFWNGPVMVNPDPSLCMNRHIIYPISILLPPKGLPKIFSFFEFYHEFTNVRKWLVRLSENYDSCKESVA